ncbi:hypothetical protein [Aequorivita sp. Q41]|uniref:hypothetical protein n=1 Tax=Aequorivita sp. Q41 TaxID=3153300 RepID=UPI003242E9D0
MITLSYKAKQYLLAAAKVLVLAITFGYIYYKMNANPALNFKEFTTAFFSKGITSSYLLLLFTFLAAANWFFEILKWKTLVSSFETISMRTALKQSLASLTVSLATPNRVGEYGAKALFFDPQKRKKILLLNFYSGALQMLVTSIFGTVGLFYFVQKFNIAFSIESILIIGFILLLLLGVAYCFKEKELLLKGFSIAKTVRFFKTIAAVIKVKAFLFSIVRYTIFNFLFYGLLLFFGAQINPFEAFPLLFAMYFLVSILPTLFIFDLIIRGGVAVWVFSYTGIPELVIVSTVFTMWLLNFVLPAFIGSFFVLTYQPTTR